MKITLVRSTVIDAPIDRVWSVLRDFGGCHRWNPAVAGSDMENDLDGDVVGGVRRCRLTDGSEIREQLLRHSDRNYAFSYCILDSSLPLFDYLATGRLRPITDGDRTFLHWRVQFRTSKQRGGELEDFVGRRIYELGFGGLRKFLGQKSAPARTAPSEDLTAVDAESLSAPIVVAETAGDPEVMKLMDLSIPAPGPQQVRIHQTAVAVNFLDIEYRRGLWPGFEPPGTPGVEGVGKVVDVGKQVHGIFPGDRVAYVSRIPAAYARLRCIEADACIPLPAGVTDIQASALLKGLTAALLLGRVFRAAEGDSILIESAAGGLGHLLSQWAKSMGLVVIGTVSNLEKAKFSRDHGCDHPLAETDNASLVAEVMRITNGRGVDFWVHSGAVRNLDTAIACLSKCGHCAVIDNRGRRLDPLEVQNLWQNSLTVSAPVCFDYFDDRAFLHRTVHQLFTKIENRTIAPVVETLPLGLAAEAHRRIEARETMGTLVLIPDK
jgi:NADPH:quinone reductase-like Zn-dependent oxidoreductase